MQGLITKHNIGVECDNCGLTSGKQTEHATRCGECGQFATPTSDYCGKHDINIRRLTGYDSCPKCREEHRVDRMRQERAERRANPRMHPTVDAPRY